MRAPEERSQISARLQQAAEQGFADTRQDLLGCGSAGTATERICRYGDRRGFVHLFDQVKDRWAHLRRRIPMFFTAQAHPGGPRPVDALLPLDNQVHWRLQ